MFSSNNLKKDFERNSFNAVYLIKFRHFLLKKKKKPHPLPEALTVRSVLTDTLSAEYVACILMTLCLEGKLTVGGATRKLQTSFTELKNTTTLHKFIFSIILVFIALSLSAWVEERGRDRPHTHLLLLLLHTHTHTCICLHSKNHAKKTQIMH